jgi:hypothetical protein
MIGLAYLFGWSAGLVGIVVVVALIGAITLQMAAGESLKASLGFGESFKTAFVSLVVAAAICGILLLVIHLSGKEISARGIAVLAAIGFVVNASVLTIRLKHPTNGDISFGRACWLTTLQLAFAGIMGSALVRLVEFMTT